MTQLIRHTIEFIKQKPYGQKIISQVKDEVKAVVEATPNYEVFDRQKIIMDNKTNIIRHAYYKEYRELQYLCLLILQHQKQELGFGSRQINGLIFDGAWLWEEYINLLIGDTFYHPMNKSNVGAQRLFDHGRGKIYPDFISKKSQRRIVADAKYKPIDNIGNRDYLQVLAYMFRFDSKVGLYLYPETNDSDASVMWLNSGSTYENNVSARDDICVIKHGLKIPSMDADYKSFAVEMKKNEQQFSDCILNYANGNY